MKWLLFFFAAFLSLSHVAMSDEPADRVDAQTVRSATKVLLDRHLRQEIDAGRLSQVWMRQYLKKLDPHKMHFLASDVEEFTGQATTLIAEADKGNVAFALFVAERFLTRLHGNSTIISELLENEHDFKMDESVRIEQPDYALDEASSNERWRLRIKSELLMENPSQPNASSAREFLRGRYARIDKHFHSLTSSDILTLYIETLAKTLDPHSAYFSDSFLSLHRTSLIPNYTLGFPLAYRNGDLWIVPSPNESTASYGKQTLAGYRIVAVRIEGKDPIHLTGLTEETVLRTLTSPTAELGDASIVYLDLENPQRLQRKVIACDRWLPRR